MLNNLFYNNDDMDKLIMEHVLKYFDEMMMKIFVHILDNKDHHQHLMLLLTKMHFHFVHLLLLEIMKNFFL